MSKKQLSFNLSKGKHGGRRPGAGRKRIHSKGVAHQVREKVKKSYPLHINFKVVKNVPGLRNKQIMKALIKAILNSRLKGLKVQHYSLQHNHVHLIVEASSNAILTKGMRSLTVTFAKRINAHFKRSGQVQKERYHLNVLKSLKEVKNAINYVVHNDQKHRLDLGINQKFDIYSSLKVNSFLDKAHSWMQIKALELIWVKTPA